MKKLFLLTVLCLGLSILVGCTGMGSPGPATETATESAETSQAHLENLFVDVLKARLHGDQKAFLSFFMEEGYDLDKKWSFKLTEKYFKVELDSGLKEDTFKNIVKAVFDKYDLSEYKIEDIIDEKKIEVLTYSEAKEKHGNRKTHRIERIFRRGAMSPEDFFVIAPCKIAKYSRRVDEFNQLFFVGPEHNTDYIYYIFRKSNGKWKIVLLQD